MRDLDRWERLQAWLDVVDYQLSRAAACARRSPCRDPTHFAERAAAALLDAFLVHADVERHPYGGIPGQRARIAEIDPRLAARLAPLDELTGAVRDVASMARLARSGIEQGVSRERALRTVELVEEGRRALLEALDGYLAAGPPPGAESRPPATAGAALRRFFEAERGRLAASTFARYHTPRRLLRHCFASTLWFTKVFGGRRTREILMHPLRCMPPTFLYRIELGCLLLMLVEFLDGYLITMAAPEQVRPCVKTVEGLARWLGREGHVDPEAAGVLARYAAEGREEIHALVGAGRALEAWVATHPPCCSEQRMNGRFRIFRIFRGRVWARDIRNRRRAGPIRLPDEIADRLRDGWILSGTLGRRGREWAIVRLLALLRRTTEENPLRS